MANPLYNEFNNNMVEQIKKQAMEMKQNIDFDPREKVQELLNSGQMSQSWFNQFFPIATQIGKTIK